MIKKQTKILGGNINSQYLTLEYIEKHVLFNKFIIDFQNDGGVYSVYS